MDTVSGLNPGVLIAEYVHSELVDPPSDEQVSAETQELKDVAYLSGYLYGFMGTHIDIYY